jgi:uncharacterized protein (TIGR03437 family)
MLCAWMGTAAPVPRTRAATALNRYAVFLADEPLATHFSSRTEMQSAGAAAWSTRIQTAQNSVRAGLASRNIRVTGSVNTLLNAIFVAANPSDVAAIKAIPGVVDVVKLGHSRMLLNRATTILDGPQAWNLVGGLGNAGAGIKIGILDTGIDQTHPSLQDSSLQVPAGFPKCNTTSDCLNFTNSKVIVARSYVAMDAAGTPGNVASDSTPDDYSARDRVGHGTAVATAAAGNTSTLAVTINGMAPKAWIGNYKIAGSPDVNDGAGNDAFIQAIEDAVNDGMDIVTTSFGGTTIAGPTDTGAACPSLGVAAGVPCDPLAYAFEQAAEKGVIVLAAAGNEGEGGPYGTGNYPMFNTISTPADAPSVIAVGAVNNTHGFTPDVEAPGSTLGSLTASFSDAFIPFGAYTQPMVDLAAVNDTYGCSALPQFSLLGSFALIERGPANNACNFSVKMANAVNAGALGVVFYDDTSETLINPSGLSAFNQPILFISLANGQSLANYIDAHPGAPVTINPSATEVSIGGSEILAGYSSMGPALGTNGIKPDILAVGGGSNNGDLIYLGAQSYDPLGEVYSSIGYLAAAGTSFATPLAAGAAALIKQQHPNYTGQQVKSALVNTASQIVTTDDGGFGGSANPVNILQTGSGLVAADQAISANVTIVPATVSFGSFNSGATLSQSQQLTITNTGSSSATLGFTAAPTVAAGGTTVSVNPSTLTLAAGQTGAITVSLTGKVPNGGLFYGVISVSGALVPMHVPYMFLSPLGLLSTVVNLDAISGDGDAAIAGQQLPDGQVAFQLTDQNGAPIVGAPVTFAKASGSVPLTLSSVSSATDNYGYAYATVAIGSQTGNYGINATGGGQTYEFQGSVSPQPTTNTGGIVDAASFKSPVAPGSYVAIFGNNLGSITDENYSALHLPLSMDAVTVSFDALASGTLPAVSVPGHITFVSPGQVNVQVPWELQGYSSAQAKVTLFEFGFGNVVTVPISNFAPSIFPYGSIAAAADATSGSVISATNPAKRGNYIALYCNGLGPVTNQPASGDSANSANLSRTAPSQAAVSIGGVNANVNFSGLTPGYPGLYQINVQVPASISAGNQQVEVSIGGATSAPMPIPVQ